MQSALELICLMTFWHFLADFALQTDWLQRAKSHLDSIGLIKADFGAPLWPLALGAHSAIHAGGVGVITGSIGLGAAEFFAHAVIDFLKSDGKFGIYADQLLHLVCKGIWVAIALIGGFSP